MSTSNKKCCVPLCMDSGNMQKPLHLFPNPEKDKERFNTWLYSIGGNIIGLDSEDIYKHCRVCHIHFEEKYCCRYQNLSKAAVPTLNLPGPTALPIFTYRERRPLRQLQQDMSRNLPSGPKDAEADTKHALFDVGAVENIEPCIAPKLTYMNKKQSMLQDLSNLPSTSKSSSNSANDIVIGKEFHVPVKTQNLELRADSCSLPNVLQARAHEDSTINVRHCKIHKARMNSNELELYKKLVAAKIKISKFKNRLSRRKAEMRAAKNILMNPEFIKVMDNWKSAARVLTMMQFRESRKSLKGRRFSTEEKIVALSIFKQNPKGYRFLRKNVFVLPSPQTLTKLLSKASLKPGINESIFNQLKMMALKMRPEHKLCVLIFDEMSLKAHVTYNSRKDKVTGFVTNGEETQQILADHAQVFMIRGICKNFKQPVSYTFSSGATKGPELAKQIKLITLAVQQAGFEVLATVCDQGPNNRQAIKHLIENYKADALRRGEDVKENIFKVGGMEIIPLYDPPHLLKCFRNNLLTKDLEYEINNKKFTAKWQHLELLLKENPGFKGIRMIPKLTEAHVTPHKISKMKVKYASQIFSASVSSTMGYLSAKGILPHECEETAELLLLIDRLFDSVNGSFNAKRNSKPLLGPVTPQSPHHKFWNQIKAVIRTMKFVNKKGNKEYVPTLENWIKTLENIEQLCKKLQRDFNITSIWMRHLNQDVIENFFGAIRSHGCRNVNPTASQFESAFTTLLVNNITNAHAPGANCEKDYTKALYTLIYEENECKATKVCEVDMEDILNAPIDFGSFDVLSMSSLEKDILTYVSGYFVKQLKKKTFKGCNRCHQIFTSNENNEYINRREYNNKRWLCTPSQAMVRALNQINSIIYYICAKKNQVDSIGEYTKTIILTNIDFSWIDCSQHACIAKKMLIKCTLNCLLHNVCKNINNILSGKRLPDLNNNIELMAFIYYNKYKSKK